MIDLWHLLILYLQSRRNRCLRDRPLHHQDMVYPDLLWSKVPRKAHSQLSPRKHKCLVESQLLPRFLDLQWIWLYLRKTRSRLQTQRPLLVSVSLNLLSKGLCPGKVHSHHSSPLPERNQQTHMVYPNPRTEVYLRKDHSLRSNR